MYRYETHLHTYPVSRCARITVEENLKFYKELGYDGVFITNHFLDANINIEDKSTPYEEQIEFFFSDYETGLALSQEIGIKVFCGVELSYRGTHFLVYGLDKQWYLDHPEIMEMKKSEELALMREAGALIIQAHPFQEASYIDHIRLFPRHVDGIEILNASQSPERNEMAKLYADHYALIHSAGSDNHLGAANESLAGLESNRPIEDERDFIEAFKGGELQVFFLENPMKG